MGANGRRSSVCLLRGFLLGEWNHKIFMDGSVKVLSMVVSWICVVCIFIATANFLRWMYQAVFTETAPARKTKTATTRKREFQPIYEDAVYQYQHKATGTEGRAVSYRTPAYQYAGHYSSYETYQKRRKSS